MKAVDTNILIRFLTGDDAIQAKKVYAIFKQAETERKELFVPLPVVLEMIWVLESAYEIARADIIQTLNDLLSMPVLKFDQPAVVQQLVLCAQKNTVDLSDMLIAQSAKMNGCRTIITFDKKASKYDPFELID